MFCEDLFKLVLYFFLVLDYDNEYKMGSLKLNWFEQI